MGKSFFVSDKLSFLNLIISVLNSFRNFINLSVSKSLSLRTIIIIFKYNDLVFGLSYNSFNFLIIVGCVVVILNGNVLAVCIYVFFVCSDILSCLFI